jgi:hypothetical protein
VFATDGTTPVDDVSIYAFNHDTADGFGLPLTKAGGHYCIGLVEGPYDLGFTPPPCLGLGPKTVPISVTQDMITDVILPPGFTVAGCITDGIDNPVPGVQIYAYDPNIRGFGFAPSDESGCYSGTLPLGTFDFQFIPPQGSGLGSITVVDIVSETADCPNTWLPITLPTGFTVSGKVTCQGGQIKNVFVYADPVGEPAPGDDLIGWGVYTVDDGSYGLSLVSGTYSLEFVPPPATGLDTKEITNFHLITDTMLNVNLCGICSSIWVIETVDSAGNVGADTSLALTPNYPYIPHISYRHAITAYSETLKYAWLSGTTWVSQTVDSGGRSTSLALEPTYPYTPCISHQDLWGWVLRYARRDGITWTKRIIEDWRSGQDGTSLALEPTYPYTPHISYHRPFSIDDLIHAYLSGTVMSGTWVITTVDSYGSVGRYSSLALEPTYPYTPHISYFDWDNRDLKHARLSGTTWLSETVDSAAGDVGRHTSLALDSNGNPHISYADSTNLDLKYAWLSGTTWLSETVDSEGDLGRFGTSLALDNRDNLYISYFRDDTHGDLKLARFDGTFWIIQTVDSEGDVGQYSSLALDQDGCPHISYYDATNGDLKYAYLPVFKIYLPIITKNH